jgi:hypothetical protein
MWDVTYHITDDAALGRALDNVGRSLKDNGLFLSTDWFGAEKDTQIALHVKGRSLSTYSRLLAKKNFVLVRMEPLYEMLNTPHLKRLDNHLGWLYYSLDGFQTCPSARNLSVGIWRKQAGTPAE